MDTDEHINAVETACALFFRRQIVVKAGEAYFTLGEVSALAGDFFRHPDGLINTSRKAREFLNRHRPDFKFGQRFSDAAAAYLTNREFVDLATQNYSHFRPQRAEQYLRSVPQGLETNGYLLYDAIGTCAFWHGAAIKAANRDGGRFYDRDWSLLCEGFALHFLVDLFAAGHMRVPRAALFSHFLNELDYPEANAHIVGSLLAKKQHDDDNSAGLNCKWTTSQPGLRINQEGKFYGDGHMDEVGQFSPSYLHLLRTIFAHIVHADPSLAVFVDPPWLEMIKNINGALRFPPLKDKNSLPRESAAARLQRVASEHTPWFSSNVSYEDFMSACIPEPTEDNPKPSVYATSEGNTLPKAHWTSQTSFRLLLAGKLPLDVRMTTDGLCHVNFLEVSFGGGYRAFVCSNDHRFVGPGRCLVATQFAINGNHSNVVALFEDIKESSFVYGFFQ